MRNGTARDFAAWRPDSLSEKRARGHDSRSQTYRPAVSRPPQPEPLPEDRRVGDRHLAPL